MGNVGSLLLDMAEWSLSQIPDRAVTWILKLLWAYLKMFLPEKAQSKFIDLDASLAVEAMELSAEQARFEEDEPKSADTSLCASVLDLSDCLSKRRASPLTEKMAKTNSPTISSVLQTPPNSPVADDLAGVEPFYFTSGFDYALDCMIRQLPELSIVQNSVGIRIARVLPGIDHARRRLSHSNQIFQELMEAKSPAIPQVLRTRFASLIGQARDQALLDHGKRARLLKAATIAELVEVQAEILDQLAEEAEFCLMEMQRKCGYEPGDLYEGM